MLPPMALWNSVRVVEQKSAASQAERSDVGEALLPQTKRQTTLSSLLRTGLVKDE